MNVKDHGVQEIEIDFRKYFGVLKRRWWIILSALFITVDIALVAAFLQEEEYRSEARLLFESGRQTSSLIGLEDAPQELRALTNRDDPLDTQVEILRSIPLAEQVIQELGLINPEGRPIHPNALLANLEVQSIPGTDVLKLAYTSDVPEQAMEIADAIMNAFINQNVTSNRSAAVAAQKFIEGQLPITDAQVGEAEEDLKDFKERYKIVDFAAESERIVTSVSSIEDELTRLRSQFANLDSQASNIRQRIQLSTSEAYESGVVSQSPAVKEVLDRLNEAESTLASERSRYDASHPVILELEERVDSLQSLLNQRINAARSDGGALSVLPATGNSQSIDQGLIEESLRIDNELAGISKQIDELSSTKSQYEMRARAMPSLEKRYKDLERKYDAARSTHEQLLIKLEETRVLQNQSIGNARVISPAQLPTRSTSLPKEFYLLGGGMLGLLLGLLIAFLVDFADDIHTAAELQQLYDYPILGAIDQDTHIVEVRSNSKLNARNFSISPEVSLTVFTELLMGLRNRNQGVLPKIIGITSTLSQEGHPNITAGFAIALTTLGKSVLVVDANFADPVQHHLFNISNHKGFTNILTRGISISGIIQKLNPNLHVLPAGPRVNNAKSLLCSALALDYVHNLQSEYDFILVDVPPINARLSPLNMSFINHLVIVSKVNALWKSSIHKARKRLQKASHVEVLGLFISSKADALVYKDSSNQQHQANTPLVKVIAG